LSVGATVAEAAAALGRSQGELEEVAGAAQGALPAMTWEPPEGVPLLRDLLALAAENRRLSSAVALERLECDVDSLHQALRRRKGEEAERLQALKLSALAEFAAGAGHEINNPLAVISGQAQYLLSHADEGGAAPEENGVREEDGQSPAVATRPPTLAPETRRKALQTIIGQTKRIHQLLSGLMQFARPPRPRKEALNVPGVVREVAASLQELAIQRRVRLVCPELAPPAPMNGSGPGPDACTPVTIFADRHQVGTALACLLRNAIEAAPPDGWAGVRLETPGPDRLELVVEDNGSGPSPPEREHLFEPFYSGRSAGRGKGLGLAMAWRLAREHGGDVRFDALPGGPTRFVLSLPQQTGANGVGH
jgi:signal transduction histidine kinase